MFDVNLKKKENYIPLWCSRMNTGISGGNEFNMANILLKLTLVKNKNNTPSKFNLYRLTFKKRFMCI